MTKSEPVESKDAPTQPETQPKEKTNGTAADSLTVDHQEGSLSIDYRNGSLFEADYHSIYVHSCNCVGSWGKGIAAEFKKRFPEHFKVYQSHCKTKKPKDILGTCLLIGPHLPEIEEERWVACLFTRERPGKAPASKAEADRVQTCANTTTAMNDLVEQMRHVEQQSSYEVADVVMPKINAGLFGVPWEQTVKALNEVNVPKDLQHDRIVVYEPAKSDEGNES